MFYDIGGLSSAAVRYAVKEPVCLLVTTNAARSIDPLSAATLAFDGR